MDLSEVYRDAKKSCPLGEPLIECPEGEGYGDYVIMKIDGDGKIEKWVADLSEFEANDND